MIKVFAVLMTLISASFAAQGECCGLGHCDFCGDSTPCNHCAPLPQTSPATYLSENSLYLPDEAGVTDVIPPTGSLTIRDWDDPDAICSLAPGDIPQPGSNDLPEDVASSVAGSCAIYAPGESTLTWEEEVPAAYYEGEAPVVSDQEEVPESCSCNEEQSGIQMGPGSIQSRTPAPAAVTTGPPPGAGAEGITPRSQFVPGTEYQRFVRTGPPPAPYNPPRPALSPYGNPVQWGVREGGGGMGAVPSGATQYN